LTDLLQLFDEDFDLLLSAAVPYNSHVLVHGYKHIVEIIWMPQSTARIFISIHPQFRIS